MKNLIVESSKETAGPAIQMLSHEILTHHGISESPRDLIELITLLDESQTLCQNEKPIPFNQLVLEFQTLKNKAKWLNYYDPDDILGYPLKSINEPYDNTVSEDIPINVGGLFSSWNPLSHIEYWTDDDFTKPVSKFIKTFL